MGGYAGIGTMISSIKHNRFLGHKKKTPKDAKIGGRAKLISHPIRFKNKMSSQARAIFKAQLRKSKNRTTLFIGITYLIVLSIVILFVVWFMNFR